MFITVAKDVFVNYLYNIDTNGCLPGGRSMRWMLCGLSLAGLTAFVAAAADAAAAAAM